MQTSNEDGFRLVGTSVPASTTFLRLYQSDSMFRSSLDFAAIGLIVFLFVAPLPMPSLDWVTKTSVADQKTPTAQVAVPTPSNIAMAASPPVTNSPEKVRREWFKLADPAIVSALNKAADEIDNRAGKSAIVTLEGIGRPDDPNVLNLSAYAAMLSRDKESISSGFEFHLKAAKAGHPESMDQVGQMLRLGAGTRTNLAEAVDWYERGADAGSASAAINAGRAYANGWARPINHIKAHNYYRKAAEAGEPWGMHNFGAGFINGNGIPRDAELAREWIGKSAQAGLAAGQLSLAKLHRKGIGGPVDIDAFIKSAQAAVDQNFLPALYELGMFFLEPDDKRPADLVRAANYLRQAAIKKYPKAQYAYATLCERGAGVQQNHIQAFVYYSLALRGGEKAAEPRLEGLRSRMEAGDLKTAQKLVAASS